MALNFETKTLQLAAPVNLAADTDLAAAAADESPTWIFVQNTGDSTGYWRETVAAPVATDTGHILEAGDSVVALIYAAAPFWIWSEDAAGEITISPGAPLPVRGS